MKKVYSTILMLATIVAALSLTACGGDDDDEVGGDETSTLVGTWELIQEVYHDGRGGTENYQGYGAYWVFTDHTVTIHDEEDLLNGHTIDYTLKGDKLHVAGLDVHTIVELTSSKLVLRTIETFGSYSILTFKKRK